MVSRGGSGTARQLEDKFTLPDPISTAVEGDAGLSYGARWAPESRHGHLAQRKRPLCQKTQCGSRSHDRWVCSYESVGVGSYIIVRNQSPHANAAIA